MTHRLTLSFALLSCLLAPMLAFGDDDLIDLMASMQYFSHKIQLSLDHNNTALADFYAHELEEVIEEVQEVGEHYGQSIGALTTALLLPSFEQLETAIDSGSIAAANSAFDTLLEACNSCHVATDHGVIQLRRNTANPYLQSFEMAE